MDSFRGAVSQLLGVYNDIDEAIDLASARQALHSKTYDVIILDKGLPDGDGMSLIAEIKSATPNTVVIMLTSDSDFSAVKHCIARGADDYVVKTENIIPDLLVRIPFAVARTATNNKLESLQLQLKEAFKYEIVGKSEATMRLRETIMDLKDSNAHVLITGESGTGKELIARRLNAIEADANRPFIAINCGAIPENLIESELFGHKKGSFTGATQDRPGRFELANNGDLFLDEAGELPLSAQVKLLRVIQEGEFTRVGDSRLIKVNCRVIAATNQNLEEMISKKLFREDLYHRLNVIRIRTTPLAARMEDLADISNLCVLQIGGPNYKITERAIRALRDHDWPGNVRELRNALERAIISARRRKSFEIGFDDILIQLPINDSIYRSRKLESILPEQISDLNSANYKEFMESAEKAYFRTALELASGSAIDVADRIGIARSTIFKKIKEFGFGQVTDKRQMKFKDKGYSVNQNENIQ